MGVDGCILIYEREKEERKNGKSRLSALEEGYTRSRPAIRDGNWSTGLIALLLFAIGSNIFKGFGSMMFINMLILLYYNVPVIKELMKYWDKE
jgi:preprotein translocase subunit SecD